MNTQLASDQRVQTDCRDEMRENKVVKSDGNCWKGWINLHADLNVLADLSLKLDNQKWSQLVEVLSDLTVKLRFFYHSTGKQLLKGASSKRKLKRSRREKCGSAVGWLIFSHTKNRQTARASSRYLLDSFSSSRCLQVINRERREERLLTCYINCPARDNLYVLIKRMWRDKDKSALTIIMCLLTTQ